MTFCSSYFFTRTAAFLLCHCSKFRKFIDFNNQNSVIKYVEHVLANLKLLMYNNKFGISRTLRAKEIVLMTTIS